MRSWFLLVASSVLAMSVGANAAGPKDKGLAAPPPSVEEDGPEIGRFGFDESGMDRSIPPGINFYKFANGRWDQNTAIPPDRSNYGMFTRLEDISLERTKLILEEASKTRGSKIGDLYASFIDAAAVENRGVTPFAPYAAAIKAVKNQSELARLIGLNLKDGFGGPIGLYVGVDDKNPDRPIITLSQSGLSLPDRDYYLKPDAKLAEARADLLHHAEKMLTLAGEGNAAVRAKAILALETEIAKVQWTKVESRDADKTYNPFTLTALQAQAPAFDWKAFFSGIGSTPDSLLVSQPSAIAATVALLQKSPLPVVKDYLLLHALDDAAPYLSQAFVDEQFAFYGTKLSGTPELRARWKRGVELVKGAMGEAVGKIYVERYFPPEAKAAADTLVSNVITAMDRRLQGLVWMTPETKAKARAKLATFKPKIGYPDKWRDYSALEISRDDLFGNVIRANRFELHRKLDELGKPADRDEWFMTPMEVNAYANPVWNEVVFPAAILQPPFFDPKADPAVNYGGIGAVIGHEISHHFDDQGRKYNAEGKLADWWTPEDVARFKSYTDRLVTQYDAYEPLPGQHVNGSLTLGENIADLAGLTVAHDAYLMSLGGKTPPVIEGYRADQRFYLGWAQVWRRKYREANLRQRLMTDPHSPSEQRAWVVRNLDPWYGAFGIKPGDPLYLSPDARVRIW